MNGETFPAYVEQFVVPILKPNDIVAIDNLPAHNVAGIEEMINAVGAMLRYLLPHAPFPASTAPSARSCTSSSRGNAPIVTNMQAMLPYDRNPL
jgi:hypothetical protein